MTTFDTIAVFVITISVIYSLFRGLIKEVFSLLSFVGGYAGAIKFQQQGAEFCEKLFSNAKASEFVGFVLVFLVFLFGIRLIGMAVQKAIRSADVLSALDRVLGGAIGLIKGALVVIIVMVPLELFPDTYRSVTKDSIIAPPLEELSTAMRNGLGSPKRLLDKFPGIPLDKMKEKFGKIQGDLKQLGDIKDKLGDLDSIQKLAPGVKIPQKDSKPQDEYTKHDKEQLDKLFEDIEKDSKTQ